MVRAAELLSLTRLSRKFVLNGSLQCIVDFNDIRLWFKDYGSKGKAAGKRGVDGLVITRCKLHIFAHFCIFPQFLPLLRSFYFRLQMFTEKDGLFGKKQPLFLKKHRTFPEKHWTFLEKLRTFLMGVLDGEMGGKNALKNRNMKFGTINLKNGAFSLF